MNWLRNLALGLKSLRHRDHVESELDEELRGFAEASAAQNKRPA